MNDLTARNKLREYRFEEGFIKDIACTAEENLVYSNMVKEGKPLPEGVFSYRFDGVATNEEFYVLKEGMTYEEEMEYLAFEQNKNVNTIKKCVLFFTISAIVSLSLTLLLYTVALGAIS